MKQAFYIFVFILLFGFLTSCNGQSGSKASKTPASKNELVGGGCDGCELMYVDKPSAITATDTSAGWNEQGQKLLVTGTVFKRDGKTAAPGIIIYYWQTDNDGYYSPRNGMTEKAKRHGHIRGWVKTGTDGRYAIYTIRPAPYPNGGIPAHIHTSIKEPGIRNEYYIDEFVFDDDKLLTNDERKKLEQRGGSGILKVVQTDSLQIAGHNIILGLNIPNYPSD